MVALWVVVMAVGLIGMIVCSKKQKSNPAMQPVAVGLFLVVLVGAIMLLKTMNIFGGTNASILNNEVAFAASRGYQAGKFVSGIANGKKVVLIATPDYTNGPIGKAIADAVKKGLGGELVIDCFELPADYDNSGMPISELFKAKDMDALVAKHADAGAFISTLGLPTNAGRMALLKAPADKRPAIFLLDTGAGNFPLAKAIKKGDIAGVITSAPNAKYDVKACGDMDKDFAVRYILVDKNNVDEHKNRVN